MFQCCLVTCDCFMMLFGGQKLMGLKYLLLDSRDLDPVFLQKRPPTSMKAHETSAPEPRAANAVWKDGEFFRREEEEVTYLPIPESISNGAMQLLSSVLTDTWGK